MRKLILIAALCASCSYEAEKVDFTVHVAGIPTAADHLVVVLTPSDQSVAGHSCPSEVSPTPPANAICYRPSFQPGSLPPPPAVDLAFAAPSQTGTVTILIQAETKDFNILATGNVGPLTLPTPPPAQVTLH